MGLNLGELYYQVNARTAGLRRGEKQVQDFAKNTTSAFSKISRAADAMRIILGAAAAVWGLSKLFLFADAYKQLQTRIKTATKATGDYIKVSRQLYNISQRNGTALLTNVGIFQRLARVAPELGATNDEMLELTELVGQLGIIGGSTSDQLKNGLLQFTQGLGAGIFRAEEWNSLLENTPEVANRIAEGLGKSVGALRKMVLDGKLLSEDVFRSLHGQADIIADDFSRIPDSIDKASTAMKNSFQKWLGQLDAATGATAKIANFFREIVTYLDGDWSEFFLDINVGLQELGLAFRMFNDSFLEESKSRGFFEVMIELAGKLGKALFEMLKKAPIYARYFFDYMKIQFSAITKTIENIQFFMKSIANYWNAIGNAMASPFSSKARENLSELIKLQNQMGYDNKMMNLANEESLASQLKGIAEVRDANLERLAVEGAKIEKLEREKTKFFNIESERAARLIRSHQEANPKAKPIAIDPEAEKLREQTQSRLDALAERTLNEEALLNHKYQKDLELLKTAEEMGLATIRSYNDIKEDMQRNHIEALLKIAVDGEKKKYKTFSSYSLLTEEQKRKTNEDEFRADEKKFKDQISAAAQHNKEFFELNKALAIATALIDGAAAIQSAYKWGSAFGGVVGGGISAAVAAAATGVQINAIQASRYSGARETGGDVSAGGMYRVNERGPELLSSGGKDFLMMGNKGGSVTANNKLGGGGGGTVVNIMNAPGHTARVEERQGEDGNVIDIMIEKVGESLAAGVERGGSPLAGAIERVYGANRTAGGTG